MDMDNPRGMDTPGPFEARYLAFLETITQLRPRLHRYCSRMTGSVLLIAEAEKLIQESKQLSAGIKSLANASTKPKWPPSTH